MHLPDIKETPEFPPQSPEGTLAVLKHMGSLITHRAAYIQRGPGLRADATLARNRRVNDPRFFQRLECMVTDFVGLIEWQI